MLRSLMGFQSRREPLCQIRSRYQAATHKVKRQILNEFVRATGDHRKYALRLLNGFYLPIVGGKLDGRKVTELTGRGWSM